jgi:hypothetical protein
MYLSCHQSAIEQAQLKSFPFAKLIANMLVLEKGYSFLHIPFTEEFLTFANVPRIEKSELTRTAQTQYTDGCVRICGSIRSNPLPKLDVSKRYIDD